MCFLLVGSFIPQNDLAKPGKLPQLLAHYRFYQSAAGGGLTVLNPLADTTQRVRRGAYFLDAELRKDAGGAD